METAEGVQFGNPLEMSLSMNQKGTETIGDHIEVMREWYEKMSELIAR
jgi:hypothetical protein